MMTSTDVTVRGESHIRYSVKTVRAGLVGMTPKTVFSQGEGVLATMQRRVIIPDLLTLGDKTMRLCSWLKTPIFSLFLGSFSEGRDTYIWREGRGGRIDLCKGSGTSTSSIARFYPSNYIATHNHRRMTCHAHLILGAEADLIREKVFISCVIIVQRMRKRALAREREDLLVLWPFMAGIGCGFPVA